MTVMNELIRKLRGALGMAVTWTASWSVVAFGAIYGLAFFVPSLRENTIQAILLTGLAGFVGGTVFSIALTSFFRNRDLAQLRAGWIAILGMVSAVMIPAAAYGASQLMGVGVNGRVAGLVLGALAIGGGVTGGGMIKVAQLASGSSGAVESGGSSGELKP